MSYYENYALTMAEAIKKRKAEAKTGAAKQRIAQLEQQLESGRFNRSVRREGFGMPSNNTLFVIMILVALAMCILCKK